MKKTALLATAAALILSSMPLSASAAETAAYKLSIDNRTISFPDAQPYKLGSDVMLPLRQTAQALGLKVEYLPASKEAALYGPAGTAIVKSGSNQARLADGSPIEFGADAAVKSNRMFVPLSFFERALGLRTAVQEDTATAAIFTPEQTEAVVRAIVERLVAGEYQQLSDLYFDDTMKQSVPVEALKAGWEQTTATSGELTGTQVNQATSETPDQQQFVVQLSFAKAKAILSLNLNADNQVSGLWLKPIAEQAETPASLIEEEVIVGEGTKYPLPGTLTLPKGASGPLPAVVLVHGSGPNDRDETVGLAKPFRDLAWGLAEQGIAVLRYDKRTYVHGQSLTPDMLASFTVKDETIDDAVAAAKLLKADSRIDASKVYVVGHSLGGMLAPRIDADGGDFAGLAILAGSPRTLWEIIADQNAALIAAMDDGDPAKAANEALVAAEFEKALALAGLTDEEAKAQTVFGIPAYYFKEMDSRGADQIAAKLTKPVLVLQGEADVQVYADKDYVQWQEALKNNDKASFKLYPGLNHFFAKSADGKVEAQVVQDIADWINRP
ncbi:alpha/beta fold hydrolase [Cohnella cellulosilytica]|uniref:Alpha/beta fold hydrolase n=1 Tax=Cohnella cellulosilytica TaxID=986710 RepID=A0ABW2FNI6_9BACL